MFNWEVAVDAQWCVQSHAHRIHWYFVIFTDDYSHCYSVYFISHKSKVLEKFKEFETATTSISGQRIGKLQTDISGEFRVWGLLEV